VAILLSGMLADGPGGLREVARHGGLTIVQDPANALAPSMPGTR
jgi:two-component system chemotaxis response regulator CheB